MSGPAHAYLVALGSNQRHPAIGSPRAVVSAAIDELGKLGDVPDHSPIIQSAPVGPSQRRYANAAAILETGQTPERLLASLQDIEQRFGRTRRGQRWRQRILDLDIALWNGGSWASEALTIPHPQLHGRSFVLGPAAQIAANWRDPITNLSLRQLSARLTRRARLPKRAAGEWALSSVGRATDF